MNRKVTWILGVTILLGSLVVGNYYLGWKIPYLPAQSTLPLLMEEPVEIYKNYQIILHVVSETYYYARSIVDSSIVSPHFLVPGDAMASIAQVKAWIDANPGPIPRIPPIDMNLILLIGIVVSLVLGTVLVWKRH